MNVSLPPDLMQKVSETIDAGHYVSENELIGVALRLFFETNELRRAKWNALIQTGLSQLDDGDGVDGNISKQRLLSQFSIPDL